MVLRTIWPGTPCLTLTCINIAPSTILPAVLYCLVLRSESTAELPITTRL